MLKKVWRLFLGLVVFAGSACVTPTHASSAFDVVLTHIQAASPASAKDEMVAIYNNSPNEVDITGWCVTNKADVAFACFVSDDPSLKYYLPAYSAAVVATESFLATHEISEEAVTQVFVVSNQSSGSIVNSSDTVTLVDAEGQVRDGFFWATAIPSGKVAMRTKSVTDPRVYETLDVGAAWSYGLLAELPMNQAELREALQNEAGLPDNTEPEVGGTELHPRIVEVLPDAVGSDAGNEFIELYNSSDVPISLAEYRLRIGQNLEKSYAFPAGAELPPFSYVAFTNSQIKFSLNNTASKLQLEYKSNPVGEVVAYQGPPAGWSWSLISEAWGYTNNVTPSQANQDASTSPPKKATAISASGLKPCAANQYRSPETNRCRLLAAAVFTSKPCASNQYRNPETNRCRLIASSTTMPKPCKEGQERNPETNRCRAIVKMTNAGYAVKGVATEQTPINWYFWLGIAGVVSLILAYVAWEWRDELKAIGKALRQKFARTK